MKQASSAWLATRSVRSAASANVPALRRTMTSSSNGCSWPSTIRPAPNWRAPPCGTDHAIVTRCRPGGRVTAPVHRSPGSSRAENVSPTLIWAAPAGDDTYSVCGPCDATRQKPCHVTEKGSVFLSGSFSR